MSECIPDYLITTISGFGLSNANDLTLTSNRIYKVFAETSRLTLKHHLFRTHMPGELFKATREIPMNDKKEEFKIGRLFLRVSKIHVSGTSNVLAEMDFADYGDGANFLHSQDTFGRYYTITFIVGVEKKGRTTDKAARAALPNWISFFGASDIVFADGYSGILGSELPRFCNGRNHFTDGYSGEPSEHGGYWKGT